MSRHTENHEKPYPDESSLEALQTGLAKSGETYKYQKNKFEQLRTKANQIKQNNQNKIKSKQNATSITFKKF